MVRHADVLIYTVRKARTGWFNKIKSRYEDQIIIDLQLRQFFFNYMLFNIRVLDYEISIKLNFFSVSMHMISPVSHLLTDFVPQKSTERLIPEVTLVFNIFTYSSYYKKNLVKRLRAFTEGSFFDKTLYIIALNPF